MIFHLILSRLKFSSLLQMRVMVKNMTDPRTQLLVGLEEPGLKRLRWTSQSAQSVTDMHTDIQNLYNFNINDDAALNIFSYMNYLRNLLKYIIFADE